MNVAERKNEKAVNEWRIIYLTNQGDTKVDSYTYQSKEDAAQMLEDQLRHGSWKAGKLIQAKDFFKL